jgi:hypothetical protein
MMNFMSWKNKLRYQRSFFHCPSCNLEQKKLPNYNIFQIFTYNKLNFLSSIIEFLYIGYTIVSRYMCSNGRYTHYTLSKIKLNIVLVFHEIRQRKNINAYFRIFIINTYEKIINLFS